eukprot:1092867-Rhodomonas_salina.2
MLTQFRGPWKFDAPISKLARNIVGSRAQDVRRSFPLASSSPYTGLWPRTIAYGRLCRLDLRQVEAADIGDGSTLHVYRAKSSQSLKAL